jgi:hypothetical protein
MAVARFSSGVTSAASTSLGALSWLMHMVPGKKRGLSRRDSRIASDADCETSMVSTTAAAAAGGGGGQAAGNGSDGMLQVEPATDAAAGIVSGQSTAHAAAACGACGGVLQLGSTGSSDLEIMCDVHNVSSSCPCDCSCSSNGDSVQGIRNALPLPAAGLGGGGGGEIKCKVCPASPSSSLSGSSCSKAGGELGVSMVLSCCNVSTAAAGSDSCAVGCCEIEEQQLVQHLEVEACAVCLDAAVDVTVIGCGHGICSECAEKVVLTQSGQQPVPPLCPFCRSCIKGFEGYTMPRVWSNWEI